MVQFGKMETLSKAKILEIALGIVVLGALATAGYFAWQRYGKPIATVPTPVPLTQEEASKADLGSGLLEKAQNPIQNKLPETVAPVPNPIQDIYKNPFQ